MEQVPEDASVTVRKLEGGWLVRVVGDGEVVEERFDDEDSAEEFAKSHRTRLGLKPQQDVS